MTEWQVNDSKLVMNQKNTGRYSNTTWFYITEWTQQTRPETVADKHKQNVSFAIYRGDEALAVLNANNKN